MNGASFLSHAGKPTCISMHAQVCPLGYINSIYMPVKYREALTPKPEMMFVELKPEFDTKEKAEKVADKWTSLLYTNGLKVQKHALTFSTPTKHVNMHTRTRTHAHAQ